MGDRNATSKECSLLICLTSPLMQFFKSYSEVILNITVTDLHLLVLHVQYSPMIY